MLVCLQIQAGVHVYVHKWHEDYVYHAVNSIWALQTVNLQSRSVASAGTDTALNPQTKCLSRTTYAVIRKSHNKQSNLQVLVETTEDLDKT